MTINLFTVYDAAAARYLEPFHAPTIEYAIRQFRSSVEQEGHMFAKYPEDYTLFHIGEYNQETGLLTPNAAPVSLGVAITFVPQTPSLQVENG
jgi:hypothetical protein